MVQSMRSLGVGHDFTFTFTFTLRRLVASTLVSWKPTAK